jgi:hypothetical protein
VGGRVDGDDRPGIVRDEVIQQARQAHRVTRSPMIVTHAGDHTGPAL